MVGLCLLLMVVALIVSGLLTWTLVLAGGRVGHLDQPGAEAHKGHARAVPNSGGIAIFIALVAPIMVAVAGIWLVDAGSWPDWLAPLSWHAAGLRSQTPIAAAVLICLAVMHGLGLIDDRVGLSAAVKLSVQLSVAAVLAVCFDVRIFHFLDSYGELGVTVSVVASVLWITAIINAMNMLDNMDGLSGGVGAIIAAVYLAATLIGGQWFVAAVSALLLGALIGFLLFNFPPAKIFMGDSGSMVVGLTLAVVSIRTTYVHWPASEEVGVAAAWHAVLMPLVILAVPLYDLVSVCLIRLKQGRSPMAGDQSHFSHRLVQRGMNRRTAVLVIWLATVATGLGGVMFNTVEPWQAMLIAAQALGVVALLTLLENKL